MANNQVALVAAGRFEPRQQLNAWETAKARFMEGLDPAEKIIFNEATVENLFYSSSVAEKQDSRDSKVRSAIEKIKPLITALEDYGKALDVYVQISPLHLSPIWGSIRVVLVIASAHSKFHGRMVEVLGRIGELLPRFHDYEKLFDASKHPRFVEALSKSYLDIIELCTKFKKTIRDQKVSHVKRLFQPISASMNLQLEDSVVRFKDHRKLVEKEAELCHMSEEKKARELVLRNKEETEMRMRVHRQKDLITRLSSLDHKYKHRQMQRLRHPGTGSWALSIFRSWLNGENSAILCCSGIPGSGKSILTSTLIDTAQRSHEGHSNQIVYFYCDYADKGTLDPSKIFSNLAQQLLIMLGQLPENILALLDEFLQYGKPPDIEDVMELIHLLLEQFDTLIFFVDGIDELTETDKTAVVKRLWSLIHSSSSNTVKMYISGREDATRLIKSPNVNISTIRICQESINGDIGAFVKHKVRNLIDNGELVIGHLPLEEEIIKTLVEGSKGMFLWVKFQLEDLCACDSDNAIRTALQNLPKNLSETYDRFLKRVDENENGRREHLKRIFSWVLCARRPLSVNEIREAIAFTIDDNHFDTTKLPNDLCRLARASGNLIVIDETTQHVQLAHYTVQQYLSQDRKAGPSFFCSTSAEANEQVGLLCLAYLNFSDFEQQINLYRDTGVNSNITAIENLVTTQSLLPSNAMGTSAVKFLRRVRARHQSSTKIDFAQYVELPKGAPEYATLPESFVLLSYITENWLYHTKYLPIAIFTSLHVHTVAFKKGRFPPPPIPLSPEQEFILNLFRALVFDKKFPFQIWPCDDTPFRDSGFLHVLQIGLALQTNHIPLSYEIINRRPPFHDGGLVFHLERMEQWVEMFWKDQQTQHVSPDIQHQLDKDYSGRFPTIDNWEGWIYYQALAASAQDDFTSLRILLGVRKPYYLLVIYQHLLLDAVIHTRVFLADYLCAQMETWKFENLSDILVRTQYDGLYCDAFELACLLNCDSVRIAISSLNLNRSSALPFHDSLFATDRLEDAIKSRDTLRVTNLLRAIGGPDWRPKENFMETEIFNTIEYGRFHSVAAITLCVGLLEERMTISQKKYNQHWVPTLPGLSPLSRIDLILITGGKPSREDGLFILKDIIQNQSARFETPLHLKRVERLITAGVPIFGTESQFNVTGDPVMKSLRKAGFQGNDLTPICYSIIYGRYMITEMLVEAGALDREYYSNFSVLHLAILSCSVVMLELLFNHGNKLHLTRSILEDLRKFMVDYCKDDADVRYAFEKRIDGMISPPPFT